MAISEVKETERVNTGIDQDGAVVREQTNSIETKPNSKNTAVNIIWYLYGLLAAFLVLRLILKLLGANSNNGFVGFIYSVSGALNAPFANIFGVTTSDTVTNGSQLEFSVIVAIIVYALIAFGVAKLLTLNDNRR